MTTEQRTEVAPVNESNTTKQEPEKTISVDLYGEQIELPLSKAKAIISKRDTKTKEYNDLKGKIETAEKKAADESSRAALLEMMRKQDVEAVEQTISAKYKDTIEKFQNKVFNGEIKAALAKNGVLPEALSDATKLLLSDMKPELDGEEVKLAGKKADEVVAEWIKAKPHLVSVKAEVAKKPTTPGKAPNSEGFEKFVKGVFNKG